MAYSVISGRRIYGKFFAHGKFGPTNIPRKLYFEHRELFQEMEIDDVWLSKKFGRTFPNIKFIPTKIWEVDFQLLIEVAKLLGIQYKTKGNKEYTDTEKRALRKCVLNRIEGEDDTD